VLATGDEPPGRKRKRESKILMLRCDSLSPKYLGLMKYVENTLFGGVFGGAGTGFATSRIANPQVPLFRLKHRPKAFLTAACGSTTGDAGVCCFFLGRRPFSP
jgi:hypothetical protein